MNYPVWELYFAGGGLLIAFIAVVHVYVSHFAVGGGLFLVLSEIKAYREASAPILEYTRRHAKFFLLLTMVFGGLTGVGIWFTIALLNPAATSDLIHTFVFGWATEWVCFLGEIVALFIYYYTFGKMRPRQHLKIGWLYFMFAWLSLFLINGIIDFMLTPGRWLEDGNFWSGFFNPTMWPAMFFRTSLAFMFSGIFGILTAVFIKDDATRRIMVRYCGRWVLFPFVAVLVSGYWYFKALPAEIQEMITRRSPELWVYFKWFWIVSAAIFVIGVLKAAWAPQRLGKALAFVLLAIGLMYMGTFEFMREGGRRPYVIYKHIFTNSMRVRQQAEVNRRGILQTARWVKNRQITAANQMEAGREIFRLECISCHSVGGVLNDILPVTAKFSVFGMDSQLDGMGKINRYMPPFFGTRQERLALANYIVRGLHGKKDADEPVVRTDPGPVDVPAFDADKDSYVLLAWNDLGMHCISDSDPYWVLLPPANDLMAQLIKRGPKPEVVTRDVVIEYRVEPDFENPASHVAFWNYAHAVFGKSLKQNIGLSGNGLKGEMEFNAERRVFEADLIPVVPYPDSGGFNPYPMFTITARDKKTGRVLATTKTTAPTSTEMGCRNCHGGKWRVAGVAGFSAETAMDVLKMHDKHNRTDLLARSRRGKPVLCQSCHADPILGAKGDGVRLNLPAAIHGWHANYLSMRGTEACYKCHPSSPRGPTKCLRGIHSKTMDCTSCHGTLEDHALSLLKAEAAGGKAEARRLMAHLVPRKVASVGDVKGRKPWFNEPDCLACHQGYGPAAKGSSSFNRWTAGREKLYRESHGRHGSLMCEACHGAPHAIFPAANPYGFNRDNIAPIQYQQKAASLGKGNCRVCHLKKPGRGGHHDGM